MLYNTSSLMKCQVKKYSGLNFARKIRPVAPDISSKIWYCGTSIGLTYDGLIASDWASVITAMTSQISVTTVVGVLATLVTAGIGLVFLWWGVRKAVGSLMGSFRSGRIRL